VIIIRVSTVSPFNSRMHSEFWAYLAVFCTLLILVAGQAVSADNTGPVTGTGWTQAVEHAGFSDRLIHSTVVYDDSLWVIGGETPQTVFFNDVWRSDDGVTWMQVTPNANFGKRAGHRSIVFDNKMWVIGGRDDATRLALNDVWYSSDGVTWTRATSSASFPPRWDFGTTVFDGKMWIVGGTQDGTPLNDVWYSSDGVTWTQATASPGFAARMEPSLESFNGKLWMTGGYSWGPHYNDVWSSSDGITWTQVTASAAFPKRRYQNTEVLDGKLWVIGGYSGSSTLRDVWYTSDGVTWTEATPSAEFPGRYGFTTAAFRNRLWVIGGTTGNDVWYSEGAETPVYGPDRRPEDDHYISFDMRANALAPNYAYDLVCRGELGDYNTPWVYNVYMFGQDSSGMNGKVAVYGTTTSGSKQLSPASPALVPGQNYHIVWRYNENDGGELFINGVSQGAATGGGKLNTGLSSTFHIGENMLPNPPAPARAHSAFNGVITNVEHWDRDLDGVTPIKIQADFKAEPVSGPAPLTVHFTDMSTSANPITGWQWDFENHGHHDSFEQNPTYTYTVSGTYPVSLTASTAQEHDEEIKTQYITVTEPASVPKTIGFTFVEKNAPGHSSLDNLGKVILNERENNLKNWGVTTKYDNEVTREDFGTNAPSTQGLLNSVTLHYHMGHGNVEGGPIPRLVLYNNQEFYVYGNEVQGKWNSDNKWVIMDACLIMSTDDWSKAMTSTHGIMGYSTEVPADMVKTRTFAGEFFRNSNDLTVYQAFRKATKTAYKNDPVQARAIFRSQDQANNDFLPGVKTGVSSDFVWPWVPKYDESWNTNSPGE
jgi:PKD repeat protein